MSGKKVSNYYCFFILQMKGKDSKDSKDSNPFGKQKTVSLDFDEEQAREGRHGNFKISKLITFN